MKEKNENVYQPGSSVIRNSQFKDLRKPYRKPILIQYGLLRDLTLAPTPGFFESGPGFSYKGNGWNL